MKKVALIAGLCLILVGCGMKATPANFSGQEQRGQLVHSILRSDQYFSDRASGIAVGESMAVGMGPEKTLILALNEKESTGTELLITLVEKRWTGKVIVCLQKQPEYELPNGWNVIVDEQLLRDLGIRVMPSIYITEGEVVRFRMSPFVLSMWEQLALGFDGDYSHSMPVFQSGEQLPTIELTDKIGNRANLVIEKPTVLILLDTSCVVCDAAVDWLAHNHKKIDSEIVVVITRADTYRMERMSALRSVCGVDGDVSVAHLEETVLIAQEKQTKYTQLTPRSLKVVFDNQDQVLGDWGIYSWPTLVILDSKGRIVERMVLSWGEGNLDGVVFADPLESISGVLSRLD